MTQDAIDKLKLLHEWLKPGMPIESISIDPPWPDWSVWLEDDQKQLTFHQLEVKTIDFGPSVKYSHDVLSVRMPFGKVSWIRH